MNLHVLTFLVLCVGLIALAARAKAQIGIGSSLHDDTEVVPGTTYNGTIVVRNTSSTMQEVKLYQTDYTFQANGANRFDEPGTIDRSNASWTHVSSSYITVPPDASIPVNYVVEVPPELNGKDLRGSYWSMIMIEGIPRSSPESVLTIDGSSVKLGVRQVIRYGIQVATHIAGTGSSQLRITDPQVVSEPGEPPELLLDVHNDGDRMIRPQTWVEIYDAIGTAMGRFEGTASRLYPGTSVRERYVLDGLGAGEYKALVVFDSGGDSVDAASYTIIIEPALDQVAGSTD